MNTLEAYTPHLLSLDKKIAWALLLLRSSAPEVLADVIGNYAAQIGLRPLNTPTPAVHGKTSGLAPWQLNRAKSLFEANLCGGIGVEEVASACRLSISHFSHAFRQSTGLSPHNWLIRRRVEKAKEMLCTQNSPLCEIAIECGFTDQSHFTRLFGRESGMTPRHWRRMHWIDAPSHEVAAEVAMEIRHDS